MCRHLSLTLICALVAAAGPADEPTKPASRTICGTVCFKGKPVAEAGVRLLSTSSPPATTDEQGRFTLPWPDDGHSWRRELFALDPRGRMGWLDVSWSGDPRFFDPGLRIDLLNVAPASGRLMDAVDKPIRQAKVRVKYLTIGDPERGRTYPVPEEMAEWLASVTNDEGQFILRKDVPAGCGLFAEVTAPGFGSPQLAWKQDVPCNVRLEKAGSIRLRFEGAADSTKLAGLRIYPWQKPAASDSAVAVYGWTEVVADGTVPQTIADIVPGRYAIQPVNSSDIGFLIDSSPEFTVPPGGVGEVTVKVTPAAEVRGRVIEAKTRKGIAGLTVGITEAVNEGGRQIVNNVKTDADGNFRVFVKPGDIGVGVFGSGSFAQPMRYLPQPEDQQAANVSVGAGKSHTFPVIVLEPCVTVDGVVVDQAGAPQRGVSVVTAHNVHGLRAFPVSDAAGRFRLIDLGPDDVTALRARTPTATTAGAVQVNVKDLKGRVKLVVSEVNASRIRGRIVDPDGNPIADAFVGVGWVCRGVGRSARSGISESGGAVRTGADGRFETLALWPDEDYTVTKRGRVRQRGIGEGAWRRRSGA
jgi:hypothetical protein